MRLTRPTPSYVGRGIKGLLGTSLALVVGFPAGAQTTDGCSYDPSTLTVSAFAADQTFPTPSDRDTAPENQLVVGPMGASEFDGVACGAATVTNTDAIVVTGEPYTDLFVDLAGGMFAPRRERGGWRE